MYDFIIPEYQVFRIFRVKRAARKSFEAIFLDNDMTIEIFIFQIRREIGRKANSSLSVMIPAISE